MAIGQYSPVYLSLSTVTNLIVETIAPPSIQDNSLIYLGNVDLYSVAGNLDTIRQVTGTPRTAYSQGITSRILQDSKFKTNLEGCIYSGILGITELTHTAAGAVTLTVRGYVDSLGQVVLEELLSPVMLPNRYTQGEY